MLAAAAEFAEEFYFVEFVVAVGVAHAIEAAAFVGFIGDHDVETVEGVEQSLRLAEGEIDDLDLEAVAGAERRRGEAVELAVLIGDDEAALGVHAHRDPGTLDALGHGVEQLDFEIFRHLERCDGRGAGTHSGGGRSRGAIDESRRERDGNKPCVNGSE